MDTIIYYFSATGNSLNAARDLAERTGETKLISIPEIKSEADFSAESIGIVFPVYMWGVPSIVKRFIESMGRACRDKYIFALATCKSSPGGVMYQLSRELRKQDLKLSAGFTVPMPGNNTIFYEPDSAEVQNAKFGEWRKSIDDIASFILNKEYRKPKYGSFIERTLLTGFLHRMITGTYNNADKNFCTDSNCTACGICASVCPSGNISITDNKPVWLHRCEQCTACLNLCPNKAIRFKKSGVKGRYKNPFVKLDDLKRNR